MSKSIKDKIASPECNSKCRSKKDAEKLINVISKSTDEACLVYLSTTGICHNPGKVVDNHGRSLLHLAASLGKKNVVEWLLKFKDGSINSKDLESGYTALHRSLLHGHVDVAKFLIESGANQWIQDNDGLIPFEHHIKDRILSKVFSTLSSAKSVCEVYLWGANTNFNLGLGHQHQRPQPEMLDQFRKDQIFCKQIKLQKFHSAFLTSSGHVLTCGHGQGGRLGLGTEEAQLTPHLIKAPTDLEFVSIALGVDHSIFLASNGNIWTCGSNAYHQLGHNPPPRQLLSPQPISTGGKGKLPAAVGIDAARFHSLCWSRDGLYTWGLNAGQLGHTKGEDKTIISPKFVSALSDKKIRDVSTSDGAIVVLTETGDVFAIHDFATRRIISVKQIEVVKMVATGGHLNSRVMPSTDLVEGGGEDLKVYFLTKNGRILVWQDNRQQVQVSFCVVNAARELWINDMALGKSGSMLVITNEGLGFELSHVTKSKSANPKSDNFTDILKIKSRLPAVYRATAIACDPKGNNFGVLQVCPNYEMTDFPDVDPSSMENDYRTLLDQTDEFDPLHDVVVSVDDKEFRAHKFILANSCEKFAKLVKPDEERIEINDPIAPEIFEQLLKFIYTRTCDLMKVGPTNFRMRKSYSNGDQNRNVNNREDVNYQIKSTIDHGQVSAFQVYSENNKNNSKNSKKTKKPLKKSENNNSGTGNPISSLIEAAKIFGLTNLVSCLTELRYSNGVIEKVSSSKPSRPNPRIRYSRKSLPELYDICIRSEDGLEYSAHRCVLAARLDYFRSMFATGCWIESRRSSSLSLSMPGRILGFLLDYIYSDELPLRNLDEPEFYCNLIVNADQYLVPRLIQMCEQQLAGMLTLKNVGEILQFSFDFNAGQLKKSAMQFSCHNLASLLEFKGLESVDAECLKGLSDYYRSIFRCVDTRRITPYDGGPSTDDIERHFDEIGLSVEDIFTWELEDESSTAKTPTSAKKPKPTTNRVRKMSSGSVSSLTSDSDDESRKERNNDSIFDEFGIEEKPISAKEEEPWQQKDDQKLGQKFLTSFFGGAKHDVMVPVRKPPNVSAIEQTTTNQKKLFSKLSQKERKRLTSLSQKEESPPIPDTPPPQVPKWSGWSVSVESKVENVCGSGAGALSLAEIIEKERLMTSPAGLTGPPRKMSPDIKPMVKKETIPKKAAWKQLSFEAEPSKIASPPKNPWKIPSTGSPTPQSASALPPDQSNFKQILNDQAKQSENLARAQTKPLWVTQIEEKAIEELKVFYAVDKVFDELITVARVDEDRVLATPIWRKNLSKK